MGQHLSKARSFIGDLPGIRHWRHERFRNRFENGQAVGTCRGVFDSYEAAAAAAPASRPLGYDHDDAAGMYHDRIGQIYPSDYPMMFWLQRALDLGARRVFDLGGHIGLSYYSYATRMALPEDLSWQVCDVPAVVDSGRREAAARDGSGRLRFTADFAEAAQADVLFTAGCLQYLQETLAQRVASLPRQPEWLLVNLLPLHPARGYWTVQSIGTAYCPYRIQHDDGFFQDILRLGYRRLDRWENLEKSCWVAFDDLHSLDRYHGAAFRLDPASIDGH